MYPIFNIFGLQIPAYQVMSLIGVIITFIFILYVTKREKQNINNSIYIFLFVLIGVLIGGRFVFAIVSIDTLPSIINNFILYKEFDTLLYDINRLFSGQVFYGGLYGGFLGLYVYSKINKLDAWHYLWLFTPTASLFHIFGRMGCFFAGCCYGVPIAANRYTFLMNGGDVARIPTQLIESCFNIILFVLLFILQKKPKFKTHLFRLYIVFYSVFRFTLEFWRGDEVRGIYGLLSTSQIIALLSLIVVSATYIYAHFKKAAK